VDHQAKLLWARKHLDTLEVAIAGFLKDKPYGPRTHDEYQGGQRAVRSITLHIIKTVPADFGLIAGDVAHRLRSALDSLLFEITVNVAGPATAEKLAKHIQFPICDTKAEYIDRLRRRPRALALPPNADTVLEGLQPYTRNNPNRPDILGTLRDLDNVDKHRALLITGAVGRSSKIELANVFGADTAFISRGLQLGPFKDGAEVARIEILGTAPVSNVDVYCDLGFDIAFTQEWPGFGLPVFGTLQQLHDFVRDSVVPKLEPFLA
jgi:hypothetical protein